MDIRRQLGEKRHRLVLPQRSALDGSSQIDEGTLKVFWTVGRDELHG
jgi:hypothetical protein